MRCHGISFHDVTVSIVGLIQVQSGSICSTVSRCGGTCETSREETSWSKYSHGIIVRSETTRHEEIENDKVRMYFTFRRFLLWIRKKNSFDELTLTTSTRVTFDDCMIAGKIIMTRMERARMVIFDHSLRSNIVVL